jgi:Tol biopolymer transport system component
VFADGVSVDLSVPIDGGPSVPVTLPHHPASTPLAPLPAPGGRLLGRGAPERYGATRLYGLPVDGSQPPLELSGALVEGAFWGSVEGDFALTPDGTRALYRADEGELDADELFVAPTDGSAAGMRLNPALVLNGAVGTPSGRAFTLAPDGARVAYIATQVSSVRHELFSVPTDGSAAAVRLHALATDGGSVRGDVRFAPDGSRVVYRAGETPTKLELFSTLADGSGTPVKLSGTLVADGNVEEVFALSADGSRVVYRADEAVNDELELFSAPIDGSSARVRLHAATLATRDVTSFLVAPSGARVVFIADLDTNDVFELYGVPDTSSTPTRLSGAMVSGGNVTDVRISPDGARVVYVADQDFDDRFELYSVSIDHATPAVKLNGALVAGGDVTTSDLGGPPAVYFAISADGTRVVYLADEDTDEHRQVYSVPIDASAAPLAISGLHAGRSALSLALTHDGADVLYSTFTVGDLTQRVLFRAPLDGSTSPQLLSPSPTSVLQFLPVPAATRVLHLANAAGPSELFATEY